jgi:hypothetical protein
MAEHPGDDGVEPDMGERVKLIRETTLMSAREFVRWLAAEHGIEISYNSWLSYEQGYPMKWRTARTLCKLIPWVTLDYIYRDHVTVEMRRKLDRITRIAGPRSGGAAAVPPRSPPANADVGASPPAARDPVSARK